jgi:hypothetical protein
VRLRDVEDRAALSDLDLTVSDQLGGGVAGNVHERAKVLASERPSGVGGTDRLAGSAALKQLEDQRAAGLFGRDGRHWREGIVRCQMRLPPLYPLRATQSWVGNAMSPAGPPPSR